MKLTNTKERYGLLHQLLHWTMAGLIAYILYLGIMSQSISLHKMLGLTVLALVLPRLLWRRINTEPLMPRNMGNKQRKLAYAAHLLLYVLMVALPLCGWAMSNAAGKTVSFWNYFDLPALVQPDKQLRHLLGDAHLYGGWALLILVALHVLASLYHHFILRDGLLWRMIPCSSKKAASLNLTDTEKKVIEKAPWA